MRASHKAGVYSGGASNGIPKFTYSGTYTIAENNKDTWKIRFLTSGTLTFTKLNGAKDGIQAFLVGGGGGANNSGGGGGYTRTYNALPVAKNTAYSVVIGAGGAPAVSGAAGGASRFGSLAVAYGGLGTSGWPGGHGGSGGGGTNGNSNNAYSGASDGYNGSANATANIGYGQRSRPGPNGETGSTREFGEAAGTLYAGGGGGGSSRGARGLGGAGGGGNGGRRTPFTAGSAGIANTGGGGGGAPHDGDGQTYQNAGYAAGSGIVIIRNIR